MAIKYGLVIVFQLVGEHQREDIVHGPTAYSGVPPGWVGSLKNTAEL